MPRPKKKPGFIPEAIMREFMETVVECFGRKYDDRENGNFNASAPSLNLVAAEFNITALKARKILITAGVYSTAVSRRINMLHENGKSIPEIMEETGLSRASVHSYLPYIKSFYNMKEISTNAERTKLYRERKKACQRLAMEKSTEALWQVFCLFENYPFYTGEGLKYTYTAKEEGVFVIPEEKFIAKSCIDTAYQKLLQLDGKISGPQKLEVSGVDYLYPVFLRFGVAAPQQCQ